MRTSTSDVSISAVRNSRGQVIIEYVLLIVVTIGIATIITKTLVNKDPDNRGAIMGRWQAILEQIGADDPNKSTNE